MIPENFHFLRPTWLLALVPVAALLWSSFHRSARTSAWSRVVDEHLLRHLLVGGEHGSSRWPLWALAAAWVTACVALAGPAWQRLPQPLFTSLDPTVIALDLSRSMENTDLAPSRRMRARYELQDVLDRLRGGQVALVVFSDEPYVALPLTDDDRVVSEWIPSLTGDLMPSDGNRADRAIDQAVALLEQSGAGSGRILLVTDGLDGDAGRAAEAAERAAAQGHEVSVLGTAPESALDASALEAIATAGNGRYAAATADDADLDRVLASRGPGGAGVSEKSIAHADEWRDAGIFLLFLPVLLAPLAFRRGWLAALALSLALAPTSRADASVWSDLWQRRDQQGAAALAAGRSEEAAGLFESPDWRAAAQYESGRFDEAAKSYHDLEGSESDYNLGNALARAGDLRGALAAYDDALAAKPGDEDARFNRDLVERLLREQEKQSQQQQQNEQQSEQQSSSDGGSSDQQQTGSQSQSEKSGADGQPSQAGSQSADAKQDGSESAANGGSPSGSEQSEGSEREQAAGEDGAKPEEAAQQGGADQPAQNETAEEKRNAAGQEESDRSEGTERASQDHGDPAGDRPGAMASAQRNDASKGEEESGPNSLSERLSKMLDGSASEEAKPQDRGEEQASAKAAGGDARPLTEEEQAREQRLRQVPDDPGGLLRAKIHRRYAEKRYAQEGLVPW